MNGARDQFSLPVPDSPLQEHGGAGWRRHCGGFLAELGAARHFRRGRVSATRAARVTSRLSAAFLFTTGRRLDSFEARIDRQFQLLRPKRFGDMVNRTRFYGRHGVLNAGVAGEHDQRRIVSLLPHDFDQVDARGAGHAVVRHDQINLGIRQALQSRGHCPSLYDRMSQPLKRFAQEREKRGIVVDAEDSGQVQRAEDSRSCPSNHELYSGVPGKTSRSLAVKNGRTKVSLPGRPIPLPWEDY